MKEVELSKTVKILILYILILLVFGIIRSEMVISILNESVVSIARLSSYLTLIITCLVSFVIICLIFTLPWYIIKWQNIDIQKETYLNSMNFAIITLIINELIKAVCLAIFFKEDVSYLSADFTTEQLNNGSFFIISRYLDLLFTGISIIIFGTYLKLEKASSNKNILITSCCLFASVGFVYVVFTL